MSRVSSSSAPPCAAGGRFVLGLTLAVALLAGLAEVSLRLSPPTDLHPFLGEESPLSGPFKPDPDFGVAYRSRDAFLSENAGRVERYLPLDGGSDGRPLWALFGNSFVQAPGMLADTARQRVKSHRIFNLGKNELLEVRFAQVKLL